ncbi:hypothetical protein HK102_008801, partial [Quaeritorhiza haematococci]
GPKHKQLPKQHLPQRRRHLHPLLPSHTRLPYMLKRSNMYELLQRVSPQPRRHLSMVLPPRILQQQRHLHPMHFGMLRLLKHPDL